MVMGMLKLKTVQFNIKSNNRTAYPYQLLTLKNLSEISFNQPVTIFVGENGSGKSTLLETIALKAQSISISGSNVETSLPNEWLDQVKMSWSIKSRQGFYFRANDFIRFIEETKQTKVEAHQMLLEIEESNLDPLAKMPHTRTLYELNQLYGEGLEYRSHGESFLALFQARLRPGGLYFLDEPEAPLSPIHQLALIGLIKEMVKQKAQFIIATHSPILMALPNAEILLLHEAGVKHVNYADVDHVNITRDFLNNPESFLRHL